jgi:diguanylate cyclase
MKSAKNVIKQTLASLERKSIEATPEAYEKEFNNIAKILNYELDSKQNLVKLYSALTSEEKDLINIQENNSYKDIALILAKRIPKEKVNKVYKLLIKSLKPSVSNTLDKSIENFNTKINKIPELIFQNDIQMEIKKIIEQRFNADKDVLISKTNDIDKLISLLNNHIDSAVLTNSDGVVDIQKISSKLDAMTTNSEQNIQNIHTELKNTTKSIETQMIKTNEKLEDGKHNINELKEKILELESELQATKKENEIDHLTSLLTRKAFEGYIEEIEANYQESQIDYAIIFFDIDHFKKVNDTYGHEGGDAILSTFAKILLRSTRDMDIIGRYGGEEFIGIIHYKKEEELNKYIKRIKTIINTNKFKYNEHKIPITFSAGLTLRNKNDSYDKALNLADELLYQAKNLGRNKIIFQNGVEI